MADVVRTETFDVWFKATKSSSKIRPESFFDIETTKKQFQLAAKNAFSDQKSFFCKILATVRDSEKSTRQVGYEPTKKCQKQQIERYRKKQKCKSCTAKKLELEHLALISNKLALLVLAAFLNTWYLSVMIKYFRIAGSSLFLLTRAGKSGKEIRSSTYKNTP